MVCVATLILLPLLRFVKVILALFDLLGEGRLVDGEQPKPHHPADCVARRHLARKIGMLSRKVFDRSGAVDGVEPDRGRYGRRRIYPPHPFRIRARRALRRVGIRCGNEWKSHKMDSANPPAPGLLKKTLDTGKPPSFRRKPESILTFHRAERPRLRRRATPERGIRA